MVVSREFLFSAIHNGYAALEGHGGHVHMAVITGRTLNAPGEWGAREKLASIRVSRP